MPIVIREHEEASDMAKHSIVLIPGDGIGPEVTRATRRVL